MLSVGLPWSELLALVALAFLVVHVLFDIHALKKAAESHKDLWWTSATLIALGGHIAFDML